ncbi:MAG: PAS domain S-box protein [bacterium]
MTREELLERLVDDRTAEVQRTLRQLRQEMAERARAEGALRQSEERFRALVQHLSDVVLLVEPDGRVRYASGDVERSLGYRPEDLVGGTIVDWIHPDDLERVKILFEGRARAAGSAGRAEMRVRHKDGSWRFYESIAQNLMHDPTLRAILVTSRDVTDRRRAEEALRLSEERFRALVQNLSDTMVIMEPDGTRRYVSPAAERVLGYTPEEMTGQNAFDTLHPDDLERARAAMDSCIRNPDETVTVGLRARHKDGSWRVVEVVLQNLLDNPAIRGIVINSRDITERKRTEEALRLSEERFRAVIENLSDVVTIMGRDGMRRYTSAAQASLGYSPEELIGKDPLEMVHPDDLGFVSASMEEILLSAGAVRRVEMRVRCKDGSWRHVDAIGRNLMDNPAIAGLLITSRDVTERKRTEEALQEEKDFTGSLIQACPAFFITIDPDARVHTVNASMLQAFGYELEEIVGKYTMRTLVSPAYYEGALGFFEQLVQAKEPSYVVAGVLTKDGRERLVEWHGRPVLKAGGEVDFVFALGIDVTERRRMEEEAIKAQKMESIGVLAGGIAHDFNNILGAIVLNISLAEMEVGRSGDGERIFGLLAEAKKASLRAKGITQQLLTFSKGGLPVKKPLRIAETIRESSGLALAGSLSRCETDLPEGLWTVEADDGQIGQVIGNLVLNADQAMAGGGTILIRAENVTVGEEDADAALEPGRYVRITVRDEGVGIPPEHLHKIFDPYFSTKRQGNGLGLAVSYSIVQKHGGAILVSSRPGVETIFSVYLPASDRRPAGSGAPEKKPALASGRILVVDDDEMLLKAVTRALEKLGYRADACRDGTQALDLYDRACQEGPPIDVVLMDLTIPGGMGGRETMKKLRQIHPDARVIVSSGYSNDPILSSYAEFGFSGVITKPYRFEDLAEILRRVLSRSQSHGGA